MKNTIDISVSINGKEFEDSVIPRMTLLDFLRDKARLTGTHTGCEHGVCGACSVIFRRGSRKVVFFAGRPGQWQIRDDGRGFDQC